ncbi:hypothetical protein [Cohnella fermenti]|uniref:Uncharacterized protein n=1 Tax=Cohnella fermenti TaxID=2565925 RepID=A0A4S4BJU3_9BACL|nr:hypothetical protein [Cohnella fermenti]THF74385.1 hypothetical protein E6C55_25415 [Cohnella fermenti]
MDIKSMLSIVLGAAVLLFLASLLLLTWLSRANTGVGSVREYETLRLPGKATRKQRTASLLQRMYTLSERLPLLCTYLHSIRRRLTALQPYDEWKLRLETIKIALIAWSVLAIAVIAVLWWIRDPLTLAMVLMGVWVLHGMVADVFVHRLENKLLRQLRHFMADIRHHYHRHGMVDEAVYEATDSAPYEMALHGQELHALLTDSRPEERLEAYYETAPNRFLKGLAGMSHLVKEYGDKQLPTGSLYLKALGKLTTELNLTLLRREKLSYLLQGLTAIALVPMLFTKPIEAWARHYFTALDDFYASTLGWVLKAGLLLIIFLSYVLLRQMQELDGRQRAPRGKPWEQRIYELAWVRRWMERFLSGIRPSARQHVLLKETNSPLRLEWFAVRRVAVCLLAFVLALGFFVALHAAGHHRILYAPAQTSTLFGRLSPEEAAQAQVESAEDRRILQRVSGTRDNPSVAVLRELRKDPQLAGDETQLRAAAQRILGKMDASRGNYLKWWEVMLALLAGWGGYFAPFGILLFQRQMRQMERKHEVDQLYAVIGMLAEMERMSVEHLLEWLERFALVFKEPIQTCLLHYEQGAEQALEQLKTDAPFLPFARLVEKLQLAVERIPIRQAFDDLESEYVFNQEQRKQEYEQLIDSKANWGRMIGFVPLMALIFGYLVLPLVYVSLSQMSVYYEQIQRIQ